MVLEPILEPYFHTNSFGYRPRRNAHMAIDVTRRRCWKYDWLLEFDIRGMFDNIPHEYIMKALKHHTQEKWIILYCERWLKVDVLKDDGTRLKRTKGVPQGGCISPLLMNLFMHYSFDVWMERTFKQNPWVRYADDACIHCNSLEEANRIKQALRKRLGEVGLEIHQDKTNIVYCGDSNRRLEYPIRRFTFLGFEFCARPAKSKEQKLFRSFSPAISSKAVSDIRKHIKKNLKIGYRVDLSIEQLARWINPIVRGWFTYYGAFYRSELHRLARYLNDVLAAWCRRKFKNKKGKRQKSYAFLKTLCLQDPKLFVHWEVSRP